MHFRPQSLPINVIDNVVNRVIMSELNLFVTLTNLGTSFDLKTDSFPYDLLLVSEYS